MTDKKYGLILSEKGKPKTPIFQAARNVFGNDSDSEEDTSKKAMLLRPSDIIKRQTKITQEKALIEDPTVYQYDEVYDAMAENKEKEKNKMKEEKKPRYIENLLKSANKRKIENERRMERQIQKEREEEGEEFKDKDVFVTSAYKKKLEELRQEEEKEKREEYLEKIGDVTKQHDLGGFYRHLYEQKLGADKPTESKNLPSVDSDTNSTLTQTKDSSQPADDSLKKRNYRKRKTSEPKPEHSDEDIDDSGEGINRMNLENIKAAKKIKPNDENIDADSDFSIDESSDEETETNMNEEKKSESKDMKVDMSLTPEKTHGALKEEKSENQLTQESTIVEEKHKIDIWKKRTVGELFVQAQIRYYERKSARGL